MSDPIPLDVPPTPPAQRQFFPTRSEWITISGRDQIIRTALTGTLFTVPFDSILFISSAYITTVGTAVAGTVTLRTGSNSFTILLARTPPSTGASDTLPQTFPMPLIVPPGETIIISTGNATGSAGFTGWLEKKSSFGIQQTT